MQCLRKSIRISIATGLSMMFLTKSINFCCHESSPSNLGYMCLILYVTVLERQYTTESDSEARSQISVGGFYVCLWSIFPIKQHVSDLWRAEAALWIVKLTFLFANSSQKNVKLKKSVVKASKHVFFKSEGPCNLHLDGLRNAKALLYLIKRSCRFATI